MAQRLILLRCISVVYFETRISLSCSERPITKQWLENRDSPLSRKHLGCSFRNEKSHRNRSVSSSGSGSYGSKLWSLISVNFQLMMHHMIMTCGVRAVENRHRRSCANRHQRALPETHLCARCCSIEMLEFLRRICAEQTPNWSTTQSIYSTPRRSATETFRPPNAGLY